MRYALINPPWRFDGSIYFGCHERHLPLELGYTKALLEAEGHDAALFDTHAFGWSTKVLAAAVAGYGPDITVIGTAPTYLFWRCPPPELRVPQEVAEAVRESAGRIVLVGPHGSTTPRALLNKVDADAAVMGECEAILPRLAESRDWSSMEGLALRGNDGRIHVNGGPRAVDMASLPALRWPREVLHEHHHHRFDDGGHGLGAEMEVSRGCPYACTFCAKDNYRDKYRRRPLETVLDELDGLIEQGVGYVYFVDEILLPDGALLDALEERDIEFGVQTRIDLWKPDMLDRLGEAGCVSIEAGVESISDDGRDLLNKRCKLSGAQLRDRLIHAKKSVPFVQASLIDSGGEDLDAVERWRQEVLEYGVWANKPVPMFPYPGSPGYVHRFGFPDEKAWERAVSYYIDRYGEFSDIQEQQPLPLEELELPRPL
ncbi:TIGR04295 family B12-binding domain-containing radical SAM protein [Thiohalomonas denitrificans]|uniref:B12-binding domain/radical SAM domain protein, rhizo-twelve system n=1 Tax=Thiohalomonas denitrificans TaxID=415747 RepID=A0A1G5Q3E5_9GAMM|nr:TIGR04295 family B12-binding domain-containing radical SAM protein [Thiohalomonas denitrificans]SCZ56197.1 B12-binding domain/radical SAM domain protein, rhizo-twelve system [Thiohalomonas denitrificans]